MQTTMAPRDPESKTGRVWRIADTITERKGRRADRGEVIDVYVAEGGNPDTASTQFWHWKKAYEARTENCTETLPTSVASALLTVGADGRLVIPSDMRSAMQLKGGGKVIARVVDGELRVFTQFVGIARAKEIVRRNIPRDVSLSEELIAERKAEARRESGE